MNEYQDKKKEIMRLISEELPLKYYPIVCKVLILLNEAYNELINDLLDTEITGETNE